MIKKKLILAGLAAASIVTTAPALAAGTLTISNQTGIITINDNNDWDEIVIPQNKTLKARIHILSGRTKDVVIRGLNRTTSVIAPNGLLGASKPDEKGTAGKKLSNIYSNCNCTVSISKLTSRNPQKFHILGDTDKSVMLVDNVNLHTRIASGGDVHDHHTTDGFGGGVGSVIKNTEIDTFDDSIKVYRTLMTADKVTIYHNQFGSPYQFGWGGFNDAKLILKGTNTVIDNYNTSGGDYRHGVFGWVKTNESGYVRKVDFRGQFKHQVASGKSRSPLYSIGQLNNTTSVVNGATVSLFGSNCLASTGSNTDIRNGSQVSIRNGAYCK
ncbi:hypothetical protein [Echinimonas agarilytica]|uniref:Pectate lyase n=1 Tax=Echinimonas agarilytica TaxID=1215918 RepID=A0AA41W762_9GAMM|nr:hypothetical protein [Echinimonas agarilytica]MCM2679892.1 hypothetical protein [Echinimonas agarilytica]